MKKTLLALSLCSSIVCFAQKEASNWFFGENAGLTFNLDTNTATASSNGQLFTREGCASISDEFGNLLFYTEGTTVFNKNHQVMSNGFGLLGDESSTQSAIVVPQPGNSNLYYVFTVGSNLNPTGLNYSKIDITLDGGLGEVIEKNINLIPNSSEKIAAVLKDCFTKDIWVVAYASEDGFSDENNTFYAFEVNATGINTTPVTSTFNTIIEDQRGYLKIAPDGKKVASANVDDGLYLYDFDTNTGKISNEIQLNIFSTNGSIFPYGVEFSPNSQLLYVNSSNDYFGDNRDNPAYHTCTLTQFNLSEVAIENTQIQIDERQLFRGGLQLGPDGKIYRALSATYNQGLPYLGVIENPNAVGAESNYIHNAVSLAPFNSSQGLPPFIASFFNTKIDIIKNGASSTSLEVCEGETYKLTSEVIPNATYIWTLNDNPLPNTSPDLEVSTSGNYEVFIIPNNGDCAIEGKAFVQFKPKPEAFNYTLIQCDDDDTDVGKTLFNLNEAIPSLTNSVPNVSVKFYLDSNRTNEVLDTAFKNTSNPQTLYVDIINTLTGCKNTSELTLEVSVTAANNVVLPALCDDDGIEDGIQTFDLNSARSLITNGLLGGLTVSFYKNYNDALLEQNPLNNSFRNTAQPYSQTIYARVENNNNCYGISTVLLTVHKLPTLEADETAFYCLNKFPEPLVINAGIGADDPNNYTYLWNTGETTSKIKINTPTTYTVTVTNVNGCNRNRTINVQAANIASIERIDIKDVTQNNTITIIASGDGTYEYALFNEADNLLSPYQTTMTFENVKPGFYTVYVKDLKNNCGVVSTKVSVIGFPKILTPNGDGFNDTWQVYGVSSMFQPNTKIQIFNRFGKLIKEINPLGNGWDGLFNGNKLPTDDYWFTVLLQDGRIFKSHFTLKN